MGQNGPYQVNHFKLWEHQKQSCGQNVFFYYLCTDGQKPVNQSGGFEDTAKFNWEPMVSLENRRCPYVFVTVCDNPSKCLLNTLQFMHVETPKERIAVIKATTHHSIGRQDSSLICQILSNLPEIMHLN